LLKRYDRGGALSTEIIGNLKADLLENIKEFLSNPFLVSLLYKSYEYKHTIPFRKHVFYRQMYDSLFESHDLTKGGFFIREKYSKLDSETFHALLRALGFVSVTLGQIEFDKDHMLSLLRRAKEQCIGLDVNEAEVLKDLITTVPLFNHEGNYYKWSHKSIQEYFAAQFIRVDAKGLQAAALRKIAEGKNIEKYFNVLDLCYDMDYKTFRQTLIYDLIDKFLRYYDLKTKGLYAQGITQDAINERTVLTFFIAKWFHCKKCRTCFRIK
jgi:predicted NACHT family NTPase